MLLALAFSPSIYAGTCDKVVQDFAESAAKEGYQPIEVVPLSTGVGVLLRNKEGDEKALFIVMLGSFSPAEEVKLISKGTCTDDDNKEVEWFSLYAKAKETRAGN